MSDSTKRETINRHIVISIPVLLRTVAILGILSSCSSSRQPFLTPESLTIRDRFADSNTCFHGSIQEGTVYETPVFSFRGSEPGLSVLIIGGTHGNEPAGFEAAYRLMDHFLSDPPRKGRLFIIPEANRVAVRLRARRAPVPDGVDIERGNLNRCYPGDPNGLPLERVAHEIMDLARKESVDLLLDLHESPRFHLGAESMDDQGQYHGLGQTLIFTPNEEAAWLGMITLDELNRDIPDGMEQFSIVERPINRSAAWAAGSVLDIPGFTVETCKQLPLEKRIAYQVKVVQRMVREMGLTTDSSG